MDSLDVYPKAAASDAKWGGQVFATGYTPIALDSVALARARMLARVEAGACTRGQAVTAALTLPNGKGSDELGTALGIWAEIVADYKCLAALDRTAAGYEAAVTSTAKLLNPTKWLTAHPKVLAEAPKL